jgi:hypothetical protein
MDSLDKLQRSEPLRKREADARAAQRAEEGDEQADVASTPPA